MGLILIRQESRLQERDLKYFFTWYPTDIILCLWSGFISPRIRTLVEKRFCDLFSKKKASNSRGVPSFLSWNWDHFFRRGKLCRRDYLDYLKNRAKSGDMAVLQLTFRNISLEKCPKIDPATGVTPSTQCYLFPILICFFLIPKEIPFRKAIWL